MTYEILLEEASSEGIVTREKDLESADGRIKGNKIAIQRNIPTIRKICTLAEEIGHYRFTIGDIIDQAIIENRKQEHKARLWAYNELVGLAGIIGGYKAHCSSRYELAEYLEVTEDFLQEAIDCYQSKYGTMTELDNYLIFFEPVLSVMEKYD